MSFTIFQNKKKAFLGYKNKKFKKSKMAIFPKGLTRGLCEKSDFSNLYSVRNIGEENVLYDNLERKNAYLGYRKENFKKLKN